MFCSVNEAQWYTIHKTAFSCNPLWSQNNPMTTVAHFLSIVDYIFLILETGVK